MRSVGPTAFRLMAWDLGAYNPRHICTMVQSSGAPSGDHGCWYTPEGLTAPSRCPNHPPPLQPATGILLFFGGLPIASGGTPRQKPCGEFTEVGVQGSGLRAQGSGLRAQGSGFRVQGSGYRVQGSGFRV